jgi:hypothetical protein
MTTPTTTFHTPDTLYHYTTRERADEVLVEVEESGVYAEISNGLYGPGFYALDLGPTDEDRDQLRWECFEHSRSAHPMDGVLVLDPGLAEPRFVYQDRHIWLLPINPGDEGPPSIGHMISAVGLYNKDRGWELIDLG